MNCIAEFMGGYMMPAVHENSISARFGGKVSPGQYLRACLDLLRYRRGTHN